jgi:hypothetical protein
MSSLPARGKAANRSGIARAGDPGRDGISASRISLLEGFIGSRYATERISIYKAEGLKVSLRAKDGMKSSTQRFLRGARCGSFGGRGKILDAKTICALAFAAGFKKGRRHP